MKKIVLSATNTSQFLHLLRQKTARNGSLVFAYGTKASPGSKLGKLRRQPEKVISHTTQGAFVEVSSDGLTLKNPWNAPFEYSVVNLPFGTTITLVGNNTFIWQEDGYWRRMDITATPGEKRAARVGGYWQQLSGYQAEYSADMKYTGRWRYHAGDTIHDPMATPANVRKIML